MRLLICTQKVDKNDEVLGFFHGWLLKLAAKFEKITVICLQKGEYCLPENIKIYTLGKEDNYKLSTRGGSAFGGQITNYKFFARFKYTLNFYRYLWQFRKEYDSVFIHMNIEYALLGGLIWKIFNKKVFLWYNHRACRIFWRPGAMFADKIFYTSPFSFFARHPRGRIMPAGIDTDLFRPDPNILPAKNSIVYIGRISPIKNIEILVEAAKILKSQGKELAISIAGSPAEGHEDYFRQIKEMTDKNNLNDKIKFLPGRPMAELPAIYCQHEIFINMTNSGSLDKTTLEAMACGCLAIVSNRSYADIFSPAWHDLLIFNENDSRDLADKLIRVMNLPPADRKTLSEASRDIVVSKHGLSVLIDNLVNILI